MEGDRDHQMMAPYLNIHFVIVIKKATKSTSDRNMGSLIRCSLPASGGPTDRIADPLLEQCV